MREIKLRCWNTTYKEMNGDAYSKLIMYKISIGENILDCKIMQYTGLLDKNGKEIYEGDKLLVNYNNIGVIDVKFKDGYFNICNFKLSDCEIIGHVYETKTGNL